MDQQQIISQLLTVFATLTELTYKEEDNHRLLSRLKELLGESDASVFITRHGPELCALLHWFGLTGGSQRARVRLYTLNPKLVTATISELERFKARTRFRCLRGRSQNEHKLGHIAR